MELAEQTPVSDRPPDLTAKQSLRSVKSSIMTALMIGSVVAIAAPLIAVVFAVLTRGAAVAFHDFPDFFVKDIPNVGSTRPGQATHTEVFIAGHEEQQFLNLNWMAPDP